MSYAWGPPEPTAEIWINGRAVPVRDNLAAALRQFRTMDCFRFGGKIWIDSLCINQADEAEKQVQVQMMASIYRHAGNIIVWLGPEDSDSDLAISYLERVSADYRAEYLEALDWSDTLTALTWCTMARVRMKTRYEELRDMNSGAGDSITPLALDMIAPALYTFFDRPYWRRLWIIQELCMGRGGLPIVCGSRVTQWRHIRDGALRCTAILDIPRRSGGQP